MSYVIDFTGRYEELNYLLRLRGTSSGIIDLANNNITNHNVDYSSTPSTLGSGTALKFNGTSSYLELKIKEDLLKNEDFTISIQAVDKGLYRSDSINPYFDSRYTNSQNIYGINGGIHFSIYNEPSYYSPDHYIFIDANRYSTSAYYSQQFSTTQLIKNKAKYHVALVNHNGKLSVAIDGIFCPEHLVPTMDKVHDHTLPIYIGYYGITSVQYKYADYTIDDFCIIKGKALWVNNFKPPHKYLPDYWLVE